MRSNDESIIPEPNESISDPVFDPADLPDGLTDAVSPEEDPTEEYDDTEQPESDNSEAEVEDPESDVSGEDDEEDDLLSAVYADDSTDEINQTDLMTVVVDYAFKRGKIKKNIRKTCRKLIKKYALEPKDHDPARSFIESCCKPFIRDIISEYEESPEQALDIAYFGAIWLVLAWRKNEKSVCKNEKNIWDYLKKHVNPEKLHIKVPKLMQDKKGKSLRILAEYTDKLNVDSIWNNIDRRIKKKILKGAFVLGTLKALKH